MYCSTCGAMVPGDRVACATCGSVVARVAARGHSGAGRDLATVRSSYARGPVLAVGSCPLCGYRGEGIPYFSRGSKIALLVGITMFTAGAMGVGGFAYYLMRKDHQLCARCGGGWGRHGVRALVGTDTAAPAPPPPAAVPTRVESPLRVGAIALYLLAAVLAVVGVSEMAVPALMVAGLCAAGGVMLQHAAEKDRERRRAALIASLQLPVLQLAARCGGKLTVTRVAAELGWPLPRAEKVLQSLDDGLRVSSEVTDEGLIVYEFRELAPPADPLD